MYVESVGLTFYPTALVVIAIIFELGGGLAVLLGWHTRFGAMILFIFTLTVSLAIHHFWSYAFEDRQLQMILFMKNLSILGGALYIYCFGAGRYSIDAKLNKGY
jgi:putative oxidoreductase